MATCDAPSPRLFVLKKIKSPGSISGGLHLVADLPLLFDDARHGDAILREDVLHQPAAVEPCRDRRPPDGRARREIPMRTGRRLCRRNGGRADRVQWVQPVRRVRWVRLGASGAPGAPGAGAHPSHLLHLLHPSAPRETGGGRRRSSRRRPRRDPRATMKMDSERILVHYRRDRARSTVSPVT